MDRGRAGFLPPLLGLSWLCLGGVKILGSAVGKVDAQLVVLTTGCLEVALGMAICVRKTRQPALYASLSVGLGFLFLTFLPTSVLSMIFPYEFANRCSCLGGIHTLRLMGRRVLSATFVLASAWAACLPAKAFHETTSVEVTR